VLEYFPGSVPNQHDIILRISSDTGHEVTIFPLLFAFASDANSSRAEHCQLACFSVLAIVQVLFSALAGNLLSNCPPSIRPFYVEMVHGDVSSCSCCAFDFDIDGV